MSSYGFYSLNNINQACSGGSTIQNIIGVDPIQVTTVGSTSTISLYESTPDYINFQAFNKSLRVEELYCTSLTGPGILDLIGPTGAQGPTGSPGHTGAQGPTGPQGSSATIPDPLSINNLTVVNFMTGHNAEFSGYIVGENLFATDTITAPFITSEHFQGAYFDIMTGSVRNYLEFGQWDVGEVNTNQLQIIHKNASLPTLLFIPSLQNGYMLSNTILPSDNTKNLGGLTSKWNEIHTKKLFVDPGTIEFNNSTGSNATIKSEYINYIITGPLGNIQLEGNNIQSTYMSATGMFSIYNTSELSTTLELSAKDIFTDTIQGLRRDITITPSSGAGFGGIVSITGSNLAGSIQVYTGTGCAKNYAIAQIDFIYPYQYAPSVVLQNASQSTARLLGDSQVFVDSIETRFIIYSGNTPLRNNTFYKWFYQIIG